MIQENRKREKSIRDFELDYASDEGEERERESRDRSERKGLKMNQVSSSMNKLLDWIWIKTGLGNCYSFFSFARSEGSESARESPLCLNTCIVWTKISFVSARRSVLN